ncbi:MAG: dihydroorotate dehydrogenase electron transfer subunit [Eubacteriales bacterium]
MKQVKFRIISNLPLTRDVYQMVLTGDTSGIRAGQFVNLQLDGLYLRRPISVCDCEGEILTLVYKVVGHGTEKMSTMQSGEEIDTLTGLGNGYSLDECGKNPVLLGGGVGIPPLYLLCKRLTASGANPTVILGFNKADEIFYRDEFSELGVRVIIACADGSVGVKGFVTDAIPAGEKFSYFYTCGPEPMLKAVYNSPALSGVQGEFSFEERMGCGFGACMGCSCKTITGYKRICADGPVLKKDEILWK